MKTKEERKEHALLKIEGGLTISETGKLRKQLLKYFDKNKGVTIDLKNCSQCDIAGLLLICSANKTATRENRTFTISEPSDAFKDAVDRVGLNLEDLFTNSITD